MSTYSLAVVSGPGVGQEIAVGDELILGRDEPGGLAGDGELSRRHARLGADAAGALVIEDLGSTNGTFVNGQRIARPTALSAGDRVRVGTTTLEVRGGPRPASPTVIDRPVVAPAAPAAAAPPPLPPPAFAPSAPSARPRRGVAAAVAVACLLVGGGIGAGIAVAVDGNGGGGAGGGTPSQATEIPDGDGQVGLVAYVERNVAAENGNAVLAIRFRKGDMRPIGVGAYETGGSGSFDLTDSGVLDADQQIAVDAERKLLFAVNQGSDTIAVFAIGEDGSLEAVDGSPFPSGGSAPASIGVAGDLLIVANKAQDGVRDLSAVEPSYVTFRIGSDGGLTQVGTAVPLPAGSSPTQAYVVPGTNVVVGTEEAGPLLSFLIESSGRIAPAPGSPQDPDPAIFGDGFQEGREFGLGIAAHPAQPLVYINMPTVPALAVYGYGDDGALTYQNAVLNAGTYLPCWVVVTPDGRFLYTSNAATNNVTTFDLSDPTTPAQVQTLGLKGRGNPWNEALDPTGRFLFLITPRDTTSVPEGDGNTLHVLEAGTDGQLVELDYSPLVLPVPRGTNPQGLALYVPAV